MQTIDVNVAKVDARRLYLEYRDARAPLTKVDQEAKAAYRAIAKGSTIIQAIESIVQAGLGPDGRPLLCIARATAKHCWLEMRKEATSFNDAQDVRASQRNRYVSLRTSRFNTTWAQNEWNRGAKAVMPTIPPRLRPAADQLAKFHVLWEAEWTPVPPRDPLLLRRIGQGDLWVVCAAWDLTDVERGALATRVRGGVS